MDCKIDARQQYHTDFTVKYILLRVIALDLPNKAIMQKEESIIF